MPCHEDEEDAANSDSKTVNSDFDDDGPELDIESIDDFPDIDFDENDVKTDSPDESDKPPNVLQCATKSGDSLQSSLWINSNERDIEDLKKYLQLLSYIIMWAASKRKGSSSAVPS